jgi:organic hydroperoxide reductase OsmC/OhrA
MWTGNNGTGTESYKAYSRDHVVQVNGKPPILSSSDPSFRGDPEKYNPEELFLSSLSACHMLWFLHLCADAGVVVTEYTDEPVGKMESDSDGKGRFTSVELRPSVTVTEERMQKKLNSLHEQANASCFIANSCNVKITHNAKSRVHPVRHL